MILVYTGNGKGKTSATTGQILRALGHGKKVAFGQFMKNDGISGEQKIIKNLIPDVFIAGPGFLLEPEELPKHQQCAGALLDWANEVFERVDILILDEALYALSYNIIHEDAIKKLIETAKQADKDLILSGRGLPDWLLEVADLVSEIHEIKHPYMQGIPPKKGIDL